LFDPLTCVVCLAAHIEVGVPLGPLKTWLRSNPAPTGAQLEAANKTLQQDNACMRLGNDRVARAIGEGSLPTKGHGQPVILADGAADG
jgi:hypothetical protein